MKLQLVSFEQAKALKELGFPQDEPCYHCGQAFVTKKFAYYDRFTHEWIVPFNEMNDTYYRAISLNGKHENNGEWYSRPALELVAKWLRDEKKIYIDVTLGHTQGNIVWCASLNNLGKGSFMLGDIKHVDSYEEALRASIDEAIEILKTMNDSNNTMICNARL